MSLLTRLKNGHGKAKERWRGREGKRERGRDRASCFMPLCLSGDGILGLRPSVNLPEIISRTHSEVCIPNLQDLLIYQDNSEDKASHSQ